MKILNKLADFVYIPWVRNRSNYVINSIDFNCKKILILGAREKFTQQIIDRFKNNNVEAEFYLVDKVTQISAENLSLVDADLNEGIPFDDDFFDCVVGDQLIEHLINPDKFLKEVHRCSKDNANVILGTENLASWHNIASLIMGWHPNACSYSHEFAGVGNPLKPFKGPVTDVYMLHYNVPTKSALTELIKIHNFDINEVKVFGNFLPFGQYWDKRHSVFFVINAHVNKNK